MKRFAWILPFALLAEPAASQDKAETPTKPRTVTALRVQLVLSRYKGEQKISSHPYMMSLASNAKTVLKVGTEVPVPVSTFEKDQKPVTSFEYKNVGANIECAAEAIEGGRYQLVIAAEDSSVGDSRSFAAGSTSQLIPTFLASNVRGNIVLRDGETLPLYSATDGTTGEVTKVDVTLTVMK